MKQELKIKRRLELVRTRIRELTPTQLVQVGGGGGPTVPDVPTCYMYSMCGPEYTA